MATDLHEPHMVQATKPPETRRPTARAPSTSQTLAFTRLVREHMSGAPVSVTFDTTCEGAVIRMREAATSSAVVRDGDGKLAGIITEQDVCRRIAFSLGPETPVSSVMTSPVLTIKESEYLYHAISQMRRNELRHMPVVNSHDRPVGILELDKALAVAATQIVGQIDKLDHENTVEGFKLTKTAQIDVAAELYADAVPAPEIQAMLTRINNDIYSHVCELCSTEMENSGRGPPPVRFDAIVMGSGGRGESYLNPDQDNGLILEDYPDTDHTEVDRWFITFAELMIEKLDQVGFPYCRGYVMATNPLWRKTVSQWREQTARWVGKGMGQALRLADIFFDFVPAYGDGILTSELRDHVTDIAHSKVFLREMFLLDEDQDVALGLFGRLRTDRSPGPNRGKLNLKLTGTLPLVGAVRILALQQKIRATSTLERIDQLYATGIIDHDEEDYLCSAYQHITNLLLRQQIEDHNAGRPVSNHIPPSALSRRERTMLANSFRAIRLFRSGIRSELTGTTL